MASFFTHYFDDIQEALWNFLDGDSNILALEKATALLRHAKNKKKTVVLIGNGGSAAIAEHMAVDFTKNAGLKSIAISGSPLLTAFANDFGHEKAFAKAVEYYAGKGDILFAISSSGASRNILNACAAARKKGMQLITFSGFNPKNPLRKLGTINFWIDSYSYGYVELLHNLLIHALNDALIGSAVYKSRR